MIEEQKDDKQTSSGNSTKPIVSRRSLFDIVDKDGTVMPRHYSGRARTLDEAQKMLDGLNINGEYRPYKMIPANGG